MGERQKKGCRVFFRDSLFLLFVTTITIFFHGKCCPSVVAGSTRVALLHLFHCCRLILAATRYENAWVAFRTLIHAGMNIVTEDHGTTIIFEGYITGRMTLGAIAFD